jgi:hypothetical protein
MKKFDFHFLKSMFILNCQQGDGDLSSEYL